MMSKHRLDDERGVTLVELMVVVAVLGVLAAIVGPTVFNTFQRQRSTAVAREFANELRRARNQAMSRGEIIVVEVSAANDGTIVSYATAVGLRDPDNAAGPLIYENGTETCGADSDCTPGSTCYIEPPATDGVCYAPPARSCRQVVTAGGFKREVARFTMIGAGSVDTIELLDVTDTETVCFSPDGRILDDTGSPLTIGGDDRCSGETAVFVLGKSDATVESMKCEAGIDEKELNSIYRVSLPYNGAIEVRR